MDPSSLVPWFQIGSTLITGVGVIVSITIGTININANKKERLLKIRPSLMFNLGGQAIVGKLTKDYNLPGINPYDAQKFIATLPKDQRYLDIDGRLGGLFNHGSGVAENISLWFQTESREVGGVRRPLTSREEVEAPYGREWNLIPATPTSLMTGKEARFYRFPTPLYLYMESVQALHGTFHVECEDSDGILHRWEQSASIFFDRTNDSNISITISIGRRIM